MENQELARAAYDRHLPEAMALPAERVLPFRIDPDIAIINVNKAVTVLDQVRERMAKHLPQIPVAELDGLPSLALAVKASAMAANHAVAGVSVTDMIAEGWRLRATLLPVVAGLAATGVIPQAVHDNIAAGSGVRDMAEDNIALSQVFLDYATEIADKHTADPDTIARAATVGAWLLQNLRKKHAPPASSATAESAIRDRMASLLAERYSNLRAVAYYFFRDNHDSHVPALMSRRVARKRQAEAQTPPPSGFPSQPESRPESRPSPAL